ncbi:MULTISPECIES: hypothetical protein [Rhizobium]|uniref:hypothetical protein n=1 Tax=Rhizobium TaxID=379 RepID=UPI000462E714|nr:MULTISPECIES: hypothetical protein [Rhizobium]UFS81537.1 hypothetical protein LPB79_25025 [Rhizobium sp. T136]
MWDWLSQLTGGQASFVGTLTGSILGFVALVFGALFNFRLNRRRDALLRADEAAAVTAALFSEIILVRAEVARTARLVAKIEMRGGEFEAHFMEYIRLQDPMLYKALANKLGLLDPKLVLGITAFHSRVQTVRDWLPQLVEKEDRGFSYSTLSVLEPAIQAIDEIKPILDAMADGMEIERPKDEGDLGGARDVAEMERDRFAEHS